PALSHNRVNYRQAAGFAVPGLPRRPSASGELPRRRRRCRCSVAAGAPLGPAPLTAVPVTADARYGRGPVTADAPLRPAPPYSRRSAAGPCSVIHAAIWARDRTCSLRRMFSTCVSAVRGATDRRTAIAWLVSLRRPAWPPPAHGR